MVRRQWDDHVLGLRHRHGVPEHGGYPTAWLARSRGRTLLFYLRHDRDASYHGWCRQNDQGMDPSFDAARETRDASTVADDVVEQIYAEQSQ